MQRLGHLTCDRSLELEIGEINPDWNEVWATDAAAGCLRSGSHVMDTCLYPSDQRDEKWTRLETLVRRSHPAGRRQTCSLQHMLRRSSISCAPACEADAATGIPAALRRLLPLGLVVAGRHLPPAAIPVWNALDLNHAHGLGAAAASAPPEEAGTAPDPALPLLSRSS
jgi:hypothetical protein